MSNGDQRLAIWFDHGLGDCTHFAYLTHLYLRRGYDVKVHFEGNKAAVFDAAGLKYIPLDEQPKYHAWQYRPGFNVPLANDGSGNKIYLNLNLPPLPEIGQRDEIWEELCNIQLDASGIVQPKCMEAASEFLKNLPRPIILLHTAGTNMAAGKNLPDNTVADLYKILLRETPGTLVLLDWDDRVPRLDHPRVRHLKSHWGHIDCYQLHSLMLLSDVMLGVDSGPYHFAALSKIPTIGAFTHHYPSCVTLPRPMAFNLTRNADVWKARNISRRKRWSIGEYSGNYPSAEDLARHIIRATKGPRYLRHRDKTGRDLMLQQFVRDWLSQYGRGVTIDTLLRETTHRFASPLIVETGCARVPEDWSAGFSTYVFGAYLDGLGTGQLLSIDNDAGHCDTGRKLTEPWKDVVKIILSDSVAWLKENQGRIDVLYLDSMDADWPGTEAHGLAEIKAAYPRLHYNSLVVYDDTSYSDRWKGKGALGVPYLLDQGWKALQGGSQVLLYRNELLGDAAVEPVRLSTRATIPFMAGYDSSQKAFL